MNKLSQEKQELILSHLVEGNSIRSIERITGVHRDTIIRLMLRAGDKAQDVMDRRMKEIHAENIQIDEIWTYVGCKNRHLPKGERGGERGDQWVYVAIDADTKLVPSYLVGKRNYLTTEEFISDLAHRVPGYFQLSSDSLGLYTEVVPSVLGDRIDYGQVHKEYGEERREEKRYSPAYLVRVTIRSILGEPNHRLISTSYVERQNLTMRMSMRRFTRLTNGFSKRLENLVAAVNLHFYHYNFMRVHSAHGLTPAFAAGITHREQWGWEPILR
jgi:IS1 family transposase